MEGALALSDEEAEEQWLAAWADIARACEGALRRLDARHPRRPDLVALTVDAREAADFPPGRDPRSV